MNVFQKVYEVMKAKQELAEAQKLQAKQILQQKAMWQGYWKDYYNFGIVVWEIAKQNQAKLKILAPQMPYGLMPPNYNPVMSCLEFWIKRSSSNSLTSDGSVSGNTVWDIFNNELMLAGFRNFKLTYNEDSDYYIIIIQKLEGFKFGAPISNKYGMLFFNDADGLFLKYFDSRSLYIQAGQRINLYKDGKFVQTTALLDDFGNPYLSGFNVHPRIFNGFIACL